MPLFPEILVFTQGRLCYQYRGCFGLFPGLGINLPLDSSTINGYFEFTTPGFDTFFIAEKGYCSAVILCDVAQRILCILCPL